MILWLSLKTCLCVMLDEVKICLNFTNAVEPRFFISEFCVLHNFTHSLYGPRQMDVTTMFPRFYAILGGPHKNVKSGFYSACLT